MRPMESSVHAHENQRRDFPIDALGAACIGPRKMMEIVDENNNGGIHWTPERQMMYEVGIGILVQRDRRRWLDQFGHDSEKSWYPSFR